MRLSKMVRYSASFVFFTALLLPDLCVRNSTIAFAAFVALSNPEAYNRSSCIDYYRSFQLKRVLSGAPLDHVRPRNSPPVVLFDPGTDFRRSSPDDEAQRHVALLSLFCAPRCKHRATMSALAVIRGLTQFLWSARLAICACISDIEKRSEQNNSPELTRLLFRV